MSETIQIDIPADDEGHIALQCPTCSEALKVLAADLNAFEGGELYCAACGLTNDRSQFMLTPDVQQVVHAEAKNLVANLINNMGIDFERSFRGSKFVKVKLTPAAKEPIPRLRAITDLAEVEVPCCETRIKIAFDRAATLFYCPFCGQVQT